MSYRGKFAAVSFWLALPFGIACGILMAIKAGNPFVFILGFMVGLVFVMAMYVLIVIIMVPTIKILWENFKRKKEQNS